MATTLSGVLDAVGTQLATEALQLQIDVRQLTTQLEAKKDELRQYANGNKLEIVVADLGKVHISTPRQGSEKVVLVFDEERIRTVPELRQMMLDKGIAKEEIKKTPAARASVTIEPNV